MQEVFQPLYVFHATYNATFILEPLHQLEPRPLIVHVIHAKCPLDRFMHGYYYESIISMVYVCRTRKLASADGPFLYLKLNLNLIVHSTITTLRDLT